MEKGLGREELPTASLPALPPLSVAGDWSQASALLLFLKKNHTARDHLLGFLGAAGKKNAVEEQTHGK